MGTVGPAEAFVVAAGTPPAVAIVEETFVVTAETPPTVAIVGDTFLITAGTPPVVAIIGGAFGVTAKVPPAVGIVGLTETVVAAAGMRGSDSTRTSAGLTVGTAVITSMTIGAAPVVTTGAKVVLAVVVRG